MITGTLDFCFNFFNRKKLGAISHSASQSFINHIQGKVLKILYCNQWIKLLSLYTYVAQYGNFLTSWAFACMWYAWLHLLMVFQLYDIINSCLKWNIQAHFQLLIFILWLMLIKLVFIYPTLSLAADRPLSETSHFSSSPLMQAFFWLAACPKPKVWEQQERIGFWGYQ